MKVTQVKGSVNQAGPRGQDQSKAGQLLVGLSSDGLDPAMKVVITGGFGFLGLHLCKRRWEWIFMGKVEHI